MTILFMPDISGFTQFVKDVEIKHAKHIISELLGIIQKENQKKFNLAEIEGDAIFYYQEEDKVSIDEILATIRNIHKAFHEHLNLYRYKRICNCGACTGASDLEIKFLLHIGEVEFIELNNQKKPFGSDVILIHRLCKNKIDESEYVLFTEEFLNKYEKAIQSFNENELIKLSDTIDNKKVNYFYRTLDKIELPILEKKPFPQLRGLSSVSSTIEIKKDAKDVYQYLVDLDKRLEWNVGLDDFKFKVDEINQFDTTHTCVINGRDVDIKTIYSESDNEPFVYIEETESIPILQCLITVFKVEKIGDKSNLILEVHLKPKNKLFGIFIPLLKKRLAKNTRLSLEKFRENISALT